MTLQDNSPMPSGKYKGKPMQEVPAEHLLYIYERGWCNAELKEYIEDNMQVLELEVANHERDRLLLGIE